MRTADAVPFTGYPEGKGIMVRDECLGQQKHGSWPMNLVATAESLTAVSELRCTFHVR